MNRRIWRRWVEPALVWFGWSVLCAFATDWPAINNKFFLVGIGGIVLWIYGFCCCERLR